MPKVTVAIDPEGCISAANCIGIAPQFFQIAANPFAEVLDRTGKPKGTVYSFEASASEIALLEEAAESCPTRAIIVNEEAG
jgi:ferredoxin